MLALLLAAPVMAAACATTGGPPAPSGPVELDGTRWKLVVLAGNLDGRVIEFHKRGSDGYVGELVEPGRRLANVVGLGANFPIFKLKRKKENEYEGVYKSVDPGGGQVDKEVVVFVKGNNLTWDQEPALWERR
jgi:hypothetical protein